MNKKANVYVLIMFIFSLFVILFIGFIMVTGSSVINWVFDEATPELSNLGVIGDTNFTEIADQTITPVNSIVQSFTWLTGVIYVIMLIVVLGMAIYVRESPSKFLMGFYVSLVLVLIIASIYMSNIYEDFYDGTDDLALILKEHTLLSYMILYSPAIFTGVAFIAGIILFSGLGKEGVGGVV